MEDFKAHQLCKYCSADHNEDDAEKILVLCDCCVAVGAHLGCHNSIGESCGTKPLPITPEDVKRPSFEWFCSEACARVMRELVQASNQKRPVDCNGAFTTELVRYSEFYRSSQNVIGQVESLFHSTFAPSKYSNGLDLVDLVCRGQASSLENDVDDDGDGTPDCGNFRVYVLRKGGKLVSAAAVRIHGPLFAEIPFVATKEEYRREGHCHRLMGALDAFLGEIGIKWMVVPAVDQVVDLWTKHLGFTQAPEKALEHLTERIIIPDGTSVLLKMVGSNTKSGATRSSGGIRARGKRVHFSLPFRPESPGSSDDENGCEERNNIARKGENNRKRSRNGRHAGDKDYDPFVEGDKDEEEEMPAGCSICGSITSCEWHEVVQTGDMLCDSCQTAGRIGAHSEVDKTPGRSCCNCSSTASTRYYRHERSNEWECSTCARYRQSHNGDVRPSSVYNRPKARRPKATKNGGSVTANVPSIESTLVPSEHPCGTLESPTLQLTLCNPTSHGLVPRASRKVGRRMFKYTNAALLQLVQILNKGSFRFNGLIIAAGGNYNLVSSLDDTLIKVVKEGDRAQSAAIKSLENQVALAQAAAATHATALTGMPANNTIQHAVQMHITVFDNKINEEFKSKYADLLQEVEELRRCHYQTCRDKELRAAACKAVLVATPRAPPPSPASPNSTFPDFQTLNQKLLRARELGAHEVENPALDVQNPLPTGCGAVSEPDEASLEPVRNVAQGTINGEHCSADQQGHDCDSLNGGTGNDTSLPKSLARLTVKSAEAAFADAAQVPEAFVPAPKSRRQGIRKSARATEKARSRAPQRGDTLHVTQNKAKPTKYASKPVKKGRDAGHIAPRPQRARPGALNSIDPFKQSLRDKTVEEVECILLARLKKTVTGLGGVLPPGWRLEARVRQSGGRVGEIDAYYWSPEGIRYKSIVKIVETLGLEKAKVEKGKGKHTVGRPVAPPKTKRNEKPMVNIATLPAAVIHGGVSPVPAHASPKQPTQAATNILSGNLPHNRDDSALPSPDRIGRSAEHDDPHRYNPVLFGIIRPSSASGPAIGSVSACSNDVNRCTPRQTHGNDCQSPVDSVFGPNHSSAPKPDMLE